MTLDQWFKLNIPAIPQHIFDRLKPDEAERLARSYARIDVSDHLRRNIEVDWDTWATVFQDRRVIVQNAVAEPSQAFAPWKASRRETVFAVSADGVKVKGLVELANTGRWRLTQREQKVADELFPVIAPMLDSDGTKHPVRLYGKHTAPPANNSYRNGRDDVVAAWWLDPLSHENNLAQMRSDAAGFARLYTRTREHDSAAGAVLEVVIANYRRYIKLFELGTAPPCLDAKLEARVTTKRALKKLNGVT